MDLIVNQWLLEKMSQDTPEVLLGIPSDRNMFYMYMLTSKVKY
jgi:hypothetical protein